MSDKKMMMIAFGTAFLLLTTAAFANVTSTCLMQQKFKSTSSPTIYQQKDTIYQIQYPAQVNQLIMQINPITMWENLRLLTQLHDRSATSLGGLAATSWLQQKLNNIIRTSGRHDVLLYYVKTKGTDGWGNAFQSLQPSIILKLGTSNTPGIVLGAHYDTVQSLNFYTRLKYCRQYHFFCNDNGTRSGADDDGSGTVTVLEIGRVLLNSHQQFKNPIYLIWYAAEEDGSVGSQNVVTYFQQKNIPIAAVMQLDQTGYEANNDPTMWLSTDYVDSNLTAYLATLIQQYINIKQPINYTFCGGACSDNASWYMQGIPVVFPFEAKMGLGQGYLYEHTMDDTIDKLSLTHMTDFTKLAMAFVAELAEPVQ